MTRTLGPVSAWLEADLRAAIRAHGIVLWLDPDGSYTELASRLVTERAKARLPYAVHTFRGSHLELMLSLERVAGNIDKTPLLVHLPGFDEARAERSPLYELYATSTHYRRVLATVVTEAAAGRVKPEVIAAFLEQGSLTLTRADAWLSTLLGDGSTGLLAELAAMSPAAVLSDLLAGGLLAGRIRKAEDQEALWEQMGAWLGLTDTWKESALPPAQSPRPSEVAFAIASWVLAVEYVDDLNRPPRDQKLLAMGALPKAVVLGCRSLAAHLREHHKAFYQRTADETEGWLVEEVETARAEDLGTIDTFRFEEERVLHAALDALDAESWASVLSWATERTDGRSFWVRDNPSRQAAWQLVRDAAALGAAITEAPVMRADTLEDAVAWYERSGGKVDQAHRALEQRRAALLHPQLPVFETLRARLDSIRVVWRRWADDLARAFNALCKATSFLPPPNLQQRTLFEEVVRPMAKEQGITALFLVDALRYEMATELLSAIQETPSTTAHLRARLAELPTITAVGMNALAPVADRGKLRPALSDRDFLGFNSGEFRVHDPDTRKRAMFTRVGGTKSPWFTLAGVLARDLSSLKRSISGANLVVLHSEEIDRAGEKGVGITVFDSVLQQLRTAWHLLREAGVQRFVITADHGFLLLDETTHDVQSHGRAIDPNRRHVLSPVGADHAGEVRVALSDLGYEGTDLHVMFPASTALFDTGRRQKSFAHGGNSLQERLIPVLTVVHRALPGADTLSYALTGGVREGVAGMHCIWGRVQVASQGALAFGSAREVELGLQVRDDPNVSVELCQIRGKARLSSGAVHVAVEEEFELFFKLTGETDSRVQVALCGSGSTEIDALQLDTRFSVSVLHRTAEPAIDRATKPQKPAPPSASWLEELPEGGIRQFFAHLTAHGVVTEDDAAKLLGGPRKARRFSAEFEQYAARAPYSVRIDTVAGVKRYVREGSER